MQAFSIQSESNSLPLPPTFLAEAANHLVDLTGCEFPDAIPVVLAILAGTAGPMWRTSTPVGAEICSSFNAFVAAAPNMEIGLAVAELRGQLDFEFKKQIERRLGMTEKAMAMDGNRTSDALIEAENALRAHQTRYPVLLPPAEIKHRSTLEEALNNSRQSCAAAHFRHRPWIMAESVENIQRMAEDTFDHGLFIHSPSTANINADAARLMIAGFSGNAMSLTSKTHIRPVVSNLWTGPLPSALPQYLQTFVFVGLEKKFEERVSAGLENWSRFISTVFAARLQRCQKYLPLSNAAAELFNSRRLAWNKAIARAPIERFGALANVPVHALKNALLFSAAHEFESNEEVEEVHEYWMQAGFDYAEYFARKVWTMPLKPVEDGEDIWHLIDRLLLHGPMTKREIVRSYNDVRVSELNRWLAVGVKRGILLVDGNLVRLLEPSVSASVRQWAKTEENLVHV